MFNGASGGPGVDSQSLSQPAQSKITDIAFGSNNIMGDIKQSSDIVEQVKNIDFSQAPQYGEIGIDKLIGLEAFNASNEKTPIASVTPIKQEGKMKAESVGPLPEPTPTIIPMPMNGPQGVAKQNGPKQTTGPATKLPSIDAENPNNFYIVYSHSAYNVPMM